MRVVELHPLVCVGRLLWVTRRVDVGPVMACVGRSGVHVDPDELVLVGVLLFRPRGDSDLLERLHSCLIIL